MRWRVATLAHTLSNRLCTPHNLRPPGQEQPNQQGKRYLWSTDAASGGGDQAMYARLLVEDSDEKAVL